MHTHKPIATAYDVIIAGGGAAGLSAALTLGRARRRVLLIDSATPRNRFASHMHGVLGHDGLPPLTLVDKGREELAHYGVTIANGTISSVSDLMRGLRITYTQNGDDAEIVEYARELLLATGITDELPAIPGLAEQWGAGVFHCPYCHGWEVRDQRIGVVATSAMSIAAVHQATLLRQWTDKLTIFLQDASILDSFNATTRARFDARGIQIVTTPIVEVLSTKTPGVGTLTGVRTADGQTHNLDALVVAPLAHPRDEFLATEVAAGGLVPLDRVELPHIGSFLRVDATGKTSHSRIWAVGNVVDPRLTVSAAAGQATMVAAAINFALVEEDTDSALHGAAAHSGWPEVAMDDFWEQTYSSSPARWSGRPNAALVTMLTEAFGEKSPAGTRGRAADIGSGEGADAIWLATQGWATTGVEVSTTAAQRARDAAEAAGVAQWTRFTDSGLLGFRDDEVAGAVGSAGSIDSAGSTGSPTGLDLVTASYLHSPSQERRESLLHIAGELVAPGGYLFVLSHILPDPAEHHEDSDHTGHHEHTRHTESSEPSSHTAELSDLGLDPATWHIVRAENVYRSAIFPDGTVAQSPDRALLLQRR